jgi:hypothetical protein
MRKYIFLAAQVTAAFSTLVLSAVILALPDGAKLLPIVRIWTVHEKKVFFLILFTASSVVLWKALITDQPKGGWL